MVIAPAGLDFVDDELLWFANSSLTSTSIPTTKRTPIPANNKR